MKDGPTFHEGLVDAIADSKFDSKLMLLEKVGLNSNSVAQRSEKQQSFMHGCASTTLRK